MKVSVEPDSSARTSRVMGSAGRRSDGLRAAMRASFHCLIWPPKMSASVGPSSRKEPLATPGRLTTGTMAPTTVGIWINCALANASASSGESVAPKSTLRARACWMPSPEPVAV